MEKQPSSRTCFLCGRQNDIGLKITWHGASGGASATVVVPEHFNGYPGIVHGGIVAAILDETAGRAILGDDQSFEDLMVTLKLTVRYRRPTPTGEPLTAVGWVVRRSQSRACVGSRLELSDGTVTAEADAIIVRPSEDISKRWEPEKPFWKVYDE